MQKHQRRNIPFLAIAVVALTILGIKLLSPASPVPNEPIGNGDQKGTALPQMSRVTPTADSVGSGPMDGGEKVVITFAIDTEEKKIYEQLAESFHLQNPLITVQVITPSDIFSLWNNQDLRPLASVADTTVLPANRYRLIDNSENFLDLTSLIDANLDFNVDDFWPNSLTSCQDANGRILGIPMTLNFIGFFYDATAFKAAGIQEPAPGWTIEGLKMISQSIASLQGSYLVADVSAWQSSMLAPMVDSLISRTGGQIEPSNLTSAAQWYVDMSKSNKLRPVQISDEMNVSAAKPLLWVGPLNADLPQGGDVLAIEEYRIAPFPLVSDETNKAGSNVIWPTCAVVSAGTQHPREAWTWIDFLSHQWIDQGGTSASLNSAIPARKSVAEAFYPWDQLPEDAQKSVRFGLEHGWYGSYYPQVFDAVAQAFTLALNGNNSLQSELANASIAPSPTPNNSAVIVATPQPIPDVPEGSQVIKYLYPSNLPNANVIYQNLAKSYQQEHPEVIIQLSNSFTWPGGDPLPYLAQDYDCFSFDGIDSSSDISHLSDLSPLIAQEGADFASDFYPGRIEAFTINQQIYALPSSNALYLMRYNLPLLKQLGLQAPTVDWTLDDFLRFIDEISSSSLNGPIYGAGGLETYLIASQGVQWVDFTADPPKININTPAGVQTVNWLVEMARRESIYPLSNDYSASQNSISSSQVVFWNSLSSSPANYPFETGIAPIPPIPGTSEAAGWLGESGQFISSQSKNQQACWDWMKYLSGQPNAFPDIPARQSVVRSKAYAASIGDDMAKIYDAAQSSSNRSQLGLNTLPIRSWVWQALLRVFEGEDAQMVLSETQAQVEQYTDCLSRNNLLEMDITTITVNNKPQRSLIGQCARQIDPGYQNLALP
jgi:ABC-type glycerol-3-phosphate transport system substrate-binding protein